MYTLAVLQKMNTQKMHIVAVLQKMYTVAVLQKMNMHKMHTLAILQKMNTTVVENVYTCYFAENEYTSV